jgi:hypothetical protein
MERVSDTQYHNNARFSQALPTLEEFLNQTAPHPLSLHSFIELLSHNDQLRPLEFSLEARRYGRSYYFVFQELGGFGESQYRLQHLSSLWQRLLVNYLASGSPFGRPVLNPPSQTRADMFLFASDMRILCTSFSSDLFPDGLTSGGLTYLASTSLAFSNAPKPSLNQAWLLAF